MNGNAGGGRYYAANENRIGRGIAPPNRVDLPPVIPTVSRDITTADYMVVSHAEDSRVEERHVALSATQLSTRHSVGHHCTCYVTTTQHGLASTVEERREEKNSAQRRVPAKGEHVEYKDDKQNDGNFKNGAYSGDSEDEEEEI